ncbi:MAG: hypothetical protein ABIO86_03550 [Sphingomonas sp.]
MNVAIRWEAAQIHLQDGNGALARVALDPAMFDKHGGKLAAPARAVLATLDASDAAAALAALHGGGTR